MRERDVRMANASPFAVHALQISVQSLLKLGILLATATTSKVKASTVDGFPELMQVSQQGSPVARQTGHVPPEVGGGVEINVGGGVVGSTGAGVGGGVGGSGGPHSAHQHNLPPFKQSSLTFSLKHAPPTPASAPSAQMILGRGSLLAQTCLNTVCTGLVGSGVGFADGGAVGGEVGAAVTG